MTPEQEASDPATPPERLRQMVSTLLAEAEQLSLAHPEHEGPFEVVLEGGSHAPISIIKTLRRHRKIGLKEAKDLYESAPCAVLHTRSWSEALALRDALEAQGAIVRISCLDHRRDLLMCKLAQNPSTPPDLLELLAQERDHVREAVARNPGTPRTLWMRLGERYPQQFTENPLFALLLLEDPSLSGLSPGLALRLFDFHETRARVRPILLQNPTWTCLLVEYFVEDLEEADLASLTTHANAEVRMTLAVHIWEHPACRKFLTRLLADEVDEVRSAALNNADAPWEVVELLRRAGASDDLTSWHPNIRAPDLRADEVEQLAALGPWGKQMADELRPLMLP